MLSGVGPRGSRAVVRHAERLHALVDEHGSTSKGRHPHHDLTGGHVDVLDQVLDDVVLQTWGDGYQL